MSSARPRRVLVLYWHPDPGNIRETIHQHILALDTSSAGHDVFYYNALESAPSWLGHFRFDAVILHTTFLCLRWSHLFPDWKWRLRWIADLDCLKIAIPQDEYDHAEVLDEWLWELGVNIVFSNFDEPERRRIYPLMRDRAQFYKVLTGYIDEGAAERWATEAAVPIAQRPYHVVYRASQVPYWFGSHGQLKHSLAGAVSARARMLGLRFDISTRAEDTINGEAWYGFLASGRSVIGCESGSSVLDRRGEVRTAIEWMLRNEPSLSFEDVNERMPDGWDSNSLFALSPRHLESVITRSCQILVEGSYSGVLIPNRHYLPLRKDLANLDDVLAITRDSARLQEIADRAYEEVYVQGKHTYRELADQLDAVLATCPSNHSIFAPLTLRALRWSRDSRQRFAPDVVVEAGPVPRVAPPMSLDDSRPEANGSGPRETVPARRPGLARWSATNPAKLFVLLRLLASDWALRRLLWGYLGSRSAKKAVSVVPLLEELLLLGIIRRAQAGHLTAGVQFRVKVAMNRATGRLTLLSQLPQETLSDAADRTLSEAGVARLTGIEFDHRRIGSRVNYRITTHRWVTIPLSAGRVEFKAVVELARLYPARALTAFFLTPTREAEPKRFWQDPVNYATKGWLAGRALLRDPALRRLFLAWLANTEFRNQVSAAILLEDLLKLAIIRQAQAGRLTAGRPFHVQVTLKAGTVSIISHEPDGPPKIARYFDRPIKRVQWDHSAIGDVVYQKLTKRRWVGVYLDSGRHRFDSLAIAARVRPDLLADALATLPHERLRALRNPLNYLLKGVAALVAGRRDPLIGRLMRSALRSSLDPGVVLEDTLKLALMRSSPDLEIGSRIEGGVLRLVSGGPAEHVERASRVEVHDLLSSTAFERFEWDHSKVGVTAIHKAFGQSITLHLPSGLHRFPAFSAMVRDHPESVLEAVSPFLASPRLGPVDDEDEPVPLVQSGQEALA